MTDSLNQIGTPGFGQPFHTNNLNFQPRLGIVWIRLKTVKRLCVRATAF